MTAIKWQRPGPRLTSLPFLTLTTERRLIILMPPASYTCVQLHYLGGKSAPCFTHQCPHCARGCVSETYAYAPALFFDAGRRGFMRCILPVGSPWGPLSDRDWRGFELTCCKKQRRDGTFGGIVVKAQKELTPEILAVIVCEPFDVRPRLLQRWGFDPEVEKPLPLFDAQEPDGEALADEDPATLPFPGVNGGAA